MIDFSFFFFFKKKKRYMFKKMYNTLKRNIYSTTFRQKNYVFFLKNISFYRKSYWQYIRLYNGNIFIPYQQLINLKKYFIIRWVKFFFFFGIFLI